MLRTLALVLLVAAPAVGAQTFVRADSTDIGTVVQVAAPASFQTLGLLDDFGELEGYALAARGGDGQLTVIAHELPRQPSVGGDATESVWRRATVGCGTACFVAWYADAVTGTVSPAVGSPIYEHEVGGWVLTPSADGVQILDPFDPDWVWNLTISEASPLRSAAMNLVIEAEVMDDGTLRLFALGIPDEIRTRLPVRGE